MIPVSIRPMFRFGMALLCLALASCTLPDSSQSGAMPASRTEQFDRDWKFARGAHPGAEGVGFDDTGWQPVRVPHDWAIAGPYDPQANPHTGKLPWQGEGWYRKQFVLPAADIGQRVYLDFDGVMAMPTVFVNGQKAGGWDYGYMSFRVDATKWVRFGATNLVAVHVDTRPHNSRWYPGAGIYRKVQLVLKDPVHLAQWGTFITTPEVRPDSATVQVETTIENHTAKEATADVETILLNPKGGAVASLRTTRLVRSGSSEPVIQSFVLPDPQRWDMESPHLYHAATAVYVDGRLVDRSDTPFGIRTFEFTANDGFHLNGRRVQLHGVNLHHDHGPLGAAFHVRAMERQLEIMKDMGANALRTSHNPPAPEVLDLCDRMGIVVWDEVFDKWDGTATRPEGVSMADHGRKQIPQMIRRDRNHPCVVVWSVGNEVFDLENGKFDDGPGLLRQMVEAAKSADTTRPVTLAHCVPSSAKTDLDASLDVTGWNYARRYANSRERWPDLPIIYSETASAYSTRGYYDFPHPTAKDDYPLSLRISSYDHNSAYYSDIADAEFALMEKDRFVAGEFVWTGFDYLGEPVPFVAEGWGSFKKRKITPAEESRISSFGIVDLVGIPKDRFYLYRSHWAPEKKTIHILPHWNWPDRVGTNVPVYVYTSGDSAELFVNGVSQGRRSKQPEAENVLNRYRLRWEDVIYEPGEVKAVAYKNGERLGEAVVRTAGEPAALRLTPDRIRLMADGEDLSYVLAEAVDKDGNLCPLAMTEVQFSLEGPATIAGVGNGDHHFPAEFDTDRVALFYGKAMCVVRAGDAAGAIHLRATGGTLSEARARLASNHSDPAGSGCVSTAAQPTVRGAFASGQHRNLFVEAGHSQTKVSARVADAFQQLFHGDAATEAVYFPAGTNANGPLAYIHDLGSRDVRSEGMSYGMMIAVQLDRKAEFDALWNWAMTHMYHASPTHPAYGYFSWSMTTNGVANDEMPAPDGEEYFAMALYFASARWGDGTGLHDYRAHANRLLTDMRHRKLITGLTVKGEMTAGNLFEPEHKMVRFTPDVVNWNHTDPSYHLPAFYELWARWGPEKDRAFWADAVEASRDFFHRATHPATGLAPDYANFDGSPWAAPWNPHSADFQYDSWRTAMNWSVDWAWWARDPKQRELSDRLQAFFASRGLATYGHRFKLDGEQFGHDHTTGLVSMNAVASLAATHPRWRQFVEALWNTPTPTGSGRYYDGMLYLIALLHCSGEFRIWTPR